MDLKGLEPLTSTMPLWRSPMLSYRPIGVACHPLIARNGRTRRRLRQAIPVVGGAAPGRVQPDALVGGALPGLHCPRLTATMAYYFRSTLLAQAFVLLRCLTF